MPRCTIAIDCTLAALSGPLAATPLAAEARRSVASFAKNLILTRSCLEFLGKACGILSKRIAATAYAVIPSAYGYCNKPI